MAPRPTIRRATSADATTLQALERAAGEQFRAVGLAAVADDEPFSREVLDAAATAGRSWVAVDGHDRVVGYVLVDDVDDEAHIEQISVLPDHQGQGVGRALIDHVEAWAAADGRHALTLTTFTDVPWNGPLYAHLGFRVLAEDEIGPQLRARRATEAAHGLDPRLRVCMRRDIIR